MTDVITEPSSDGRAEIEIKKSRFIGTVRRVKGTEEAKALIREERASHPDARHVVFAFLIGGPRSEIAGMSDDGEPKGTAGRPVLEVLKGSGVRNALVTVTRYFGGTRLGTGGLVKAYTECAQAALRNVAIREMRQETLYRFDLPYDCHENVKLVLRPPECRVETEVFGETVVLCAFIADSIAEKVLELVQDVSRGRVAVTSKGTEGQAED